MSAFSHTPSRSFFPHMNRMQIRMVHESRDLGQADFGSSIRCDKAVRWEAVVESMSVVGLCPALPRALHDVRHIPLTESYSYLDLLHI